MNYTDTFSIDTSITLSPTMAAASNSTFQTDTQFLSPAISQINSPQLSMDTALSTSSDASQPIRNDIEKFFHLRVECTRNLLIGFLNINSLRNKITDLRMIAERCLPDILLIEETKLNSVFKTDLLLINNYKSPTRLDRSEFGGGLMQYIIIIIIIIINNLFTVGNIKNS